MRGVSVLTLVVLSAFFSIVYAQSAKVLEVLKPIISVSLRGTDIVTSASLANAAADYLRVKEHLNLRDRWISYLGKHVRFQGDKKAQIYGGQVVGYHIDAHDQPHLEIHLYDDLYPEDMDRVQNIHPGRVTGTLTYYPHPHVGSEVEVDKIWSSVIGAAVGGKGVVIGVYEDEVWIEDDHKHYAIKVRHNNQDLLVFSDSINFLPQP